jgi:FKBP-type peptidyl-prolyl cis-trans isomerase SlyD
MPPDAVYTVTEVYPSHVVLDANHPLAGLALNIDLVVRDVRAATADEIDARTVNGGLISVADTPPPGQPLH